MLVMFYKMLEKNNFILFVKIKEFSNKKLANILFN